MPDKMSSSSSSSTKEDGSCGSEDPLPKRQEEWKWQIKNSITSLEQLRQYTDLTENENTEGKFPIRITPYYMQLILNDNTNALRKTMIPTKDEFNVSSFGKHDPLGEEHDSVVKDTIVHRYPDRVLFLTTKFCSANCRFCTRARILGDEVETDWEGAFEYIRQHTEIRDVLLSGGDPLTLSDSKIKYLLDELCSIDHIEMIRIGTKVPVVLPQRVNKKLTDILKKCSKPIYINIHFTHPAEVTQECKDACLSLANSGIPLGSQTVLMKDINDKPEIMKKLYHELLKIKVRPYYLYACDEVEGTEHFKTSLETGLNIIKSLRGYTSGLTVPHFVIDAPNGGGKIPILPNYVESYDGKTIKLKNYEGNPYEYHFS